MKQNKVAKDVDKEIYRKRATLQRIKHRDRIRNKRKQNIQELLNLTQGQLACLLMNKKPSSKALRGYQVYYYKSQPVLTHRLIYCVAYGCTLREIKGFHIHHKDKDKENNCPENLLKMTIGKHTALHNKERKVETN